MPVLEGLGAPVLELLGVLIADELLKLADELSWVDSDEPLVNDKIEVVTRESPAMLVDCSRDCYTRC